MYVKGGHNVKHCWTSPYDKNTPEKSAAAAALCLPQMSSSRSKWQFDEIRHQSTYFDLTYLLHHSSTSDIECLNSTIMMKEYLASFRMELGMLGEAVQVLPSQGHSAHTSLWKDPWSASLTDPHTAQIPSSLVTPSLHLLYSNIGTDH